MGQTLTNGIFLPNEGERNCYTGLEGNWRAIDGYIGDYNVHVADAVIHVSQADRNKWDAVTGKADASALTAHTGDNTIHVTAADKAAWNGKADDSSVMHKAGDETVTGQKTFSKLIPIDGSYLGNESSTNERSNVCLRSNRDTADKSGAYISRFRPNKNQGELSATDVSFISISFLENETRYTRCFDFGLTDWDTDGIPQTYYLISPGNKGALGTSSKKWKTMNGLEPSYLSLPSGNTADRIDISSYITAFDGTSNSYTPPANGWISISVNNSTEVYAFLNNLYGVKNSRPTAGSIIVTLPVLKGIAVAIRITDGSLGYARFIPCQGNV